jgi:hypothetical protein
MARRALRLALGRNRRQGDALAIAEVLGRMAASSGEAVYIKDLGEILLARSGFEREHGNEAEAAYYEADAWAQFHRLAEGGDIDALATLAALPRPALKVGNYEGVDDNVTAAAKGDTGAMAALYDHAAALLAVGGVNVSQALATREILARLATFASDGSERANFWRFIETMLDRDDFERRAGNLDEAQSARSEALIALGALADRGDADAPEWIERLASVPADIAVSQAIIERPTIMRFINASGEC